MVTFRCPYCGRHSNKWIDKCPDCGFIRKGKEVIIENGNIECNRGSSREKRKIRDNFRGGRNKTFAGESHKQHIERDGRKSRGNRNETIKRVKNRRGYKQN